MINEHSSESVRDMAVKYPFGSKELSAFSFLIILSALQLSKANRHSSIYAYTVLLSVCVGCLLYLVIRRTRSSASLAIRAEQLIVHKLPLAPEDIQCIWMNGSIMGVLPQGRKFVPTGYCLEVGEPADRKAMIQWSHAHGIPLRIGRFWRWL